MKTDSKVIFGYAIRESFSTSGSRSFDLIVIGPNLARGAKIGWIDIHYPCREHVRLRVKASVPRLNLTNAEVLRALSTLAIELAEAAADEIFDVTLFAAEEVASMTNRKDCL